MARPVKSRSPAPRRRYDSPLRQAKALETERRLLAAAQSLFIERGYVGTSLVLVAERAGVNPRTLYKVFASKVALLSRLVDVAVVGDQETVPVAARPWAADAFKASTGRARVRAYARVVRRVMESAGPAFRIAAQAAVADPEAASLWATGQRLRFADSTAFVASLREARLLRPRLGSRDAVATVWLTTSPETFIQLSDGLGFSTVGYERWLNQTLAAALLDRASTDEETVPTADMDN